MADNYYILKFELLQLKYYSFLTYSIFLKSLKVDNRLLEKPPVRNAMIEENSNLESFSSIDQYDEDPSLIDPKNLLATDIEEVHELFESVFGLYGSLFQFLFFGLLIYHLLGIHYLPGFLLIVVVVIITFFILKVQSNYTSKMTKITDKQIGLTEEMIYSIDVIKSSHWEKFFENKLRKLRQKELNFFRKLLIIEIFEGAVWHLIPDFIIFSALYSMYYTGGDISVVNIFPILGVVEMMMEPFEELAFSIESIVSGRISFNRIEAFLKKNTPEENEKLELLSREKSYKPEENHLEVSNLGFEYNLFSEQPSLFSLRINDLFIKKGEKVCILGKVGSGKSTMLNLLSGQMDGYKLNQYSDYFYSINGSISYVAQNSWLINASVKVHHLYSI